MEKSFRPIGINHRDRLRENLPEPFLRGGKTGLLRDLGLIGRKLTFHGIARRYIEKVGG